ncbi:MAG: LPXTG cell wall anchor domain-containing protein [Gammaproteobacteria bacterium]|nr:MAG: LPXTG cell wall anchor domain-containing protein [Gammaproteobacteria bacterium]
MNKMKAFCAGSVLLGSVLGASSVAAQQQQFPSERSQPQSCAEIRWNDTMRSSHPALIDACKEVVVAGDRTWARFEARFVRVNRDGDVVFSVRDQRGRSIEEVRLRPTANQVAYIDNQPTPFRQLRSTDTVNLYVPEGGYGFATEPGGELATVSQEPATTAETPEPAAPRQAVAQRDPLPSVLPQTSGPLPWFALGGLLSLLGGFGLTLRRRI